VTIPYKQIETPTRSTTDVVATSFQFLTHCGSDQGSLVVLPRQSSSAVTVADSLEK